MIKLKDILFESATPDIFVPRRTEDRVERLIKQYIRAGGEGNLRLSFMRLEKLPKILKNIEVKGDFLCSGNYLETLENFPKKVTGTIDISFNRIKSLQGLGVEVVNNGFGFLCNGNNLNDLKGGPKIIFGDYVCNENDLTSLEGSPTVINGNFYCSYNKLKTLEGGPRHVTKDYLASFNNLETLDGLPKFIGGDLILVTNHKVFTVAQIRAISDIRGRIELI